MIPDPMRFHIRLTQEPMSDQDAHVPKIRNGWTHLVHNAGHAVDMSSGAMVAVTLQTADQGDPATVEETLKETRVNTEPVIECDADKLIADMGCHNGATLIAMQHGWVRSYILGIGGISGRPYQNIIAQQCLSL